MTVRMESSFVDYVDLFDVAVETLETAPRRLFEKLMGVLLKKYHEEEIAFQRLALEIDDMRILPVDDLDEFYDTVLDAVDDVKLFKKKLDGVKKQEPLFQDLYEQIDALHTALVRYMDRMGQLEIRLMDEQKLSA